jgi:peptidoglycan/xylan/chitin deacetylase (PgdA/CDA1 family)
MRASTTLFITALVLWLSQLGAARLSAPATAQESALPGRARPSASVRLAISVDDLPRSRSLPDGYTSLRIVSELIKTLQAHAVASATGFVIGERLSADAEGPAALEAWLRAGYELGNHSYAHRPLDELGSEGFVADLASMEPLMRGLLPRGRRATRYFRYPNLEEGRTHEQRRALSRALRELGYTPARVSVDFFDWAWAEPYARCMRRGDAQALSLLSRAYLQFAAAQLGWSMAAAHKLLQRPFTQVLVLHANIATAANLDALLTEYERMGVQYVPLAEALADPAYTADYDAGGGTLFVQMNTTLKRGLPPWLPEPVDLLELACRE